MNRFARYRRGASILGALFLMVELLGSAQVSRARHEKEKEEHHVGLSKDGKGLAGAGSPSASKGQPELSADSTARATPADGHTVHVTAPHVVAGKVMGPYHHYCKVLSPEPVIECLCYSSNDPDARLEQVEYIIAKSITRTGAVSLRNWNKNWHDHKQEIATGRVQVHDLPPDKAKEVADLVSTTDGIIFHVWSHDDRVPSGHVIVAQSVGHVNLTQAELEQRAQSTTAARLSGKK